MMAIFINSFQLNIHSKMIYIVPIRLIFVLKYALQSIDKDIPSRWDKISSYVTGYCDTHKDVLESSTVQVAMKCL